MARNKETGEWHKCESCDKQIRGGGTRWCASCRMKKNPGQEIKTDNYIGSIYEMISDLSDMSPVQSKIIVVAFLLLIGFILYIVGQLNLQTIMFLLIIGLLFVINIFLGFVSVFGFVILANFYLQHPVSTILIGLAIIISFTSLLLYLKRNNKGIFNKDHKQETKNTALKDALRRMWREG